MRFFSTILAGAAFVSAALAISITDYPATAQAGNSYTVKYDPANDTPTTLILRKGESTNLANVSTLTTTATGGSYQWIVDKGLASGTDYALMIIQAGVANYIGPISITGGTGSVSSSISSASSATSSAASSISTSKSTASTMSTTASAAKASSSANSTVSPASLSASKTGASATASASGSATTTGSGAPQSTGGANQMGSSMALIFGAVAAMAYLN